MGTNNIPTATDGTIIPSTDHNAIKDALTNSHVPRNTSGVATDQAGSLGSSTFGWLNAFIKGVLNIGATASGISLSDDSGELVFNVGASEVARIDANGITASSFPNSGVLTKMKSVNFTASGSWVVPADTTGVIALLVGGGGGGGAGGGTGAGGGGGGGGGGGAGGGVLMESLITTPGETLTLVVGAGGAAGSGGASLDGGNGAVGGDTSITSGIWTITVPGGDFGNGGLLNDTTTGGLAGDGGAVSIVSGNLNALGGNGGPGSDSATGNSGNGNSGQT